jgi:hypothetical protein
MSRVTSKTLHALVAGALLALIVVPIAFAGADGGFPGKTTSSVKKQVKDLRRRIAGLQQQVEDLAKQPGLKGPAGPQGPPGPSTGPAGGGLTGTFPNPLIAANAIGGAQIKDDAISDAEIQASAVGNPELGNDAVTSAKIQDFGVGADDLAGNSVGGGQLKAVTAVVGQGSPVSAGTPGDAHVDCPSQGVLLAGGYAWQDDEANSIIASAPSETNPRRRWVVRGMVATGSNTLYAWASCVNE